MICALSLSEKGTPTAQRQAKTLDSAISGSFVFWAADKAMRPTLLEMLGIPREVQSGLSPKAHAAVNRALQEMHPMALRLPGDQAG